MRGSTRSCGVGEQVERLLGDRQRVHRVLVGPQQQHREVHPRRRRPAGPSARRAASAARPCAQERTRLPLPARSISAWRTRSRAPGSSVTVRRSPRLGRSTSAPARASSRSQPGTTASAHRDAPGLLHAAARRLGVHRVRQQDELGRLQRAAGHRAQRQQRADAVAGDAAAAGRRSRATKPVSSSISHSGEYGWVGRSSEAPCSGRSGSTTRWRCASASTTGSNSRCVRPLECSSASGGPVPASR